MGLAGRIAIMAMLAVVGWTVDARADRTLVVVDLRPDREARPTAIELGRAVRGGAAVAVREVIPELPEGLASARQALEAATEALTRFEDAIALEQVAAAEEALRNADADGEVRELLIRLNWVAARAHAALGRRARADAACRLAHALAPERRLPRAELPPDFVARCERAARRAPPVVRFAVAADPPGAKLSLDLAPLDPAAPSAGAGDHYLAASAPGRVPLLRRVELAAGGPAVSLALAVEGAPRAIGRAIAAATAGGRWDAVVQAVATTGATDVVVVIHAGERLSAFDAHGGALARDATPADARAAIAAHLGTPQAGTDLARGAGVRDLGRPLDRRAAPTPPWYRRGWVWVGVAAVAAGAVGAIALTPRSEGYVIDDWRLAR